MKDCRAEAGGLRGPMLVANVHRGRRIIAHLDDGDGWRSPAGRQTRNGEPDLFADGPRMGGAVDQASRHATSLPGGISLPLVGMGSRRTLPPPYGEGRGGFSLRHGFSLTAM